jgi:hypothetical protein
VLTLGLPVAIIVLRWRTVSLVRRDVAWMLALGMAASIGVFAYSITAAYSDGRFLWPIYAFTVPAAMLVLAPERAGPSTSPGAATM